MFFLKVMALISDFNLPQLWKRAGVLFGIHARSDNGHLPGLGYGPGFIWKVTATQKETIRSADHHQIDNFVTKVQKKIKNDPTKSMRAITMGPEGV